ncbi:MAG TPA: amino acid adenylation domain-containing protein, partial [Longimicrobiales bacterium]|nr:amino acid adenylation domain-containing protein [Longimicrobiales bacterium]
EYRLVWTFHHALLDGRSFPVLLREVFAAYDAILAGGAPVLEPAAPYRAYVDWLEARDPAASESFWRRALAGLAAPTPLPGASASSGRSSYADRETRLSAAASAGLRALAEREGLTLGTLVHGAWALLLARHSGEAEVVFGGVRSCRRSAVEGADSMVGLFINTLPLRVEVPPDAALVPWLRGVRARWTAIRAHEHTALSQVQAWSPLPARQPLFESIVMFERYELEEELRALGGAWARRGFRLHEQNGFPLTLAAYAGERLLLRLEYDETRFEAAAVERLLGHLSTLLEAMAVRPDARLGELPMLTAAERAQVVEEWNRTAVRYPEAERTLAELVAAQVERTPEAVAVESPAGERLTYAALDRRASALASRLRAAGVGPGELVGLCAERSLELVVGLLGILKAGGAWVPLEPEYPRERLAFMLADSGVRVLVAQGHLEHRLGRHEARVVRLEEEGGLEAPGSAAGGSEAPGPEDRGSEARGSRLEARGSEAGGSQARGSQAPAPAAAAGEAGGGGGGAGGPGDPAYMIYTSGSTGRPKGALNAHRGIVNRLLWMQAEYGLGAADVVLQKTPIGFDVAVWEFFWPLLVGARLVLARPGGHRDPAYLVELIRERGVTVLHFVPSMLRAFLAEAGVEACTSLRHVVCSGEALPADLVRAFQARSGAALHNLYGPTEAAVDVTHWTCPAGWAGAVVPIGRPVANTRIYLLDRAGQPVPVGVAGELHIGGVQVGLGYHGRPELTAERFVPDPFGGEPGARLYRTGDLARWRADGTIEFLGRLDDQVKIRGHRVEIGEVEAALLQHPKVTAAVVAARADASRGARLVAYVVAAAERPSVKELQAFVGEKLPDAMVPSAVVFLSELPLSSNGKVDRRALPEPEPDRVGLSRAYAAPATAAEVAVAAAWSRLLGGAEIGAGDDFFELGGDSLLAVRAVTQLAETTGVALPVRAIFEAPTVSALAARIDAARAEAAPRTGTGLRAAGDAVRPTDGAGAADGAAPTGPAPRGVHEAPLSFAQELLWLAERMTPGLAAYNVPELFRVRGALDVEALRGALGDLVERQDALRTAFFDVGGVPVQRVLPAGPVPVEAADLRDIPEPERHTEALRRAREAARRPFELTASPMLRATVLRLREAEWLLCLVTHHLVVDGWSRGVLFRELGELYAARRAGRAAALPALPVRYVDFAAWQRERLRGERLDALVGFWRERLRGAPAVLELATDRPRPAVRGFEGAVRSALWPPALLESARRLAQAHGATLYMALLAAFQAVLSRHSGQTDFVIGSPVAGRTSGGLEGLVGYLSNMLPVRAELRGDPTFVELLGRVREASLGALEHQEVPFESLLGEPGRGAQPSHAPIFQVMFALEHAAAAPELEGADVAREELDAGWSKYDLWLTCSESADGLRAVLEYRTDLFEAATMHRLLEHVRVLLEGAVAEPERRVSTLPLLAEEERRRLDEWNATRAAFPAGECVHTAVEAQAARTPDAVAVEDDRGSLTYAELDARANRLAHHLLALGVGRGEPVGLAVERSVELVVALLGVMKAGAAYVPLDPSYPAERLGFMLADSGARVLVTQEALRGVVPAHAGVTVSLDGDRAAIDARPAAPPPARATPADPAYVIYTSGSTGVPKGAVLPHGAVVNYLRWMQSAFALDASDCVLQKAPVSFDASVWELYLPLIAGARLFLARPDGHRDPAYLLLSMVLRRVTVVQFVPSLLAAMIEERGFPAACGDVRLLVLGGEALPGELAARARALLPRADIQNLYGPTEAAVYATSWAVPADFAGGVVPIGRPIANVQVHVVAEGTTERVPIGVAGELCIGGAGVALGYHDRPELTAERFVPDPFRAEPGARLYRTGDRARWRADGVLEYLGRLDQQVKIRGFRVELGEVEAALREHPAVRECAVVERAGRLVGYIVAGEGSEPEPAALRRHLAARLPEHMVPAALVALEALPLSANGKLDRAALPDPVSEEPVSVYVAPRNAAEATVATVWGEVLGRERVGALDDFFEIGGHSLLGMRILARLGSRLRRQLPLRLLFEARTVASLAAALEQDLQAAAEAAEMEQMLAALEQIPEEDARRLLAANPDGMLSP